MRNKRIIAILLVFALAFSVCACGKKPKNYTTSEVYELIQGRWNFTGGISEGLGLTMDDYKSVYGDDFEYYIEIESETAGYLCMKNSDATDKYDFTWTFKTSEYNSDSIYIEMTGEHYEEGSELTYTISEDRIAWVQDNGDVSYYKHAR